MVLGFYVLPTLGSAYLYGRRQATLTAFASVLMVVCSSCTATPSNRSSTGWSSRRASTQVARCDRVGRLAAHYRLYDGRPLRAQERAAAGASRHVSRCADDPAPLHLQGHATPRITATVSSVYAAIIAGDAGAQRLLSSRTSRPLRCCTTSASSISAAIFSTKRRSLTSDEYEEIKQHVSKGHRYARTGWRIAAARDPHHPRASRPVRRLWISPDERRAIPIESRIIAVADVYDSLTSDRPYRKAMSPFDARDIIVKGADTEFDPTVVTAFQKAFRQGKLEAWAAPMSAA